MKEELSIEKTIKVKGNEARVSSRDVARVFEKNHKEVLRDIKKSFDKMPDSFRERTFALSKTHMIRLCFIITQQRTT